jgi:F1F0 ATPase subunit 2
MNELTRSLPLSTPASVLLIAALAGAALGALFFGGLWWTARRGAMSRRPALWFAASLLLRMGIALPVFFVVAGGRWERVLACLAGFLVARALVTRMTRPPRQAQADALQEARHAP